MAQNKSSKNSEGVCERIYNRVCVSPFRKSQRVSHRSSLPSHNIIAPQVHQNSVSSNNSTTPQLQVMDNPAQTSSPQAQPVFFNQPSLGKMIPIEYEPFLEPAEKEKMARATSLKIQPIDHSAGNSKRFPKMANQETAAYQQGNGQNAETEAKVHNNIVKFASEEVKLPGHASKSNAINGSTLGKSHEGEKFKIGNAKFFDHSGQVENKTRKEPNVGGGVGRNATRRDSFNEKISDYINTRLMKMRRTTSLDDGRTISFK